MAGCQPHRPCRFRGSTEQPAPEKRPRQHWDSRADVNWKVIVEELNFPSTTLANEPVLTFDGYTAELALEFRPSAQKSFTQQLSFTAVGAMRFTAERHCEAWHYEKAYDRIAELGSDEQASIKNLLPGRGSYFVIAIDSWGCLEVRASKARSSAGPIVR